MKTIYSIENLHTILSGRTHSAFNRALLSNFRKNNILLTREQWTVLGVLWKNDGCTQQTLANQTSTDKPGITRLIDNLEKENLVERHPDTNDKRLKLIYLTPKGKSIEEEVLNVVNQTLKEAVKDIESERLQIVKETFQQIYDNLETKK
ncbi:DNA-binding MarR family transcriptional regulator [Flavobacterium sp. CG_9.1]|uniref:Transcriptional regulator, MarR family n=1 Tax=Flavobacterium xanthum TaxID=69322 RepID=A0A1M6X2A2_9FLAO|nr:MULTISPECIES: MarR family transcriptional regulator [Flavobacterium]MBG6061424.1 DNA-binding MarR family transcriptional regulator [Flavobacterium sp. CG_9.1]SHL00063.1 transcriptional regulator, MarR family [Flavobacterium xanthum]